MGSRHIELVTSEPAPTSFALRCSPCRHSRAGEAAAPELSIGETTKASAWATTMPGRRARGTRAAPSLRRSERARETAKASACAAAATRRAGERVGRGLRRRVEGSERARETAKARVCAAAATTPGKASARAVGCTVASGEARARAGHGPRCRARGRQAREPLPSLAAPLLLAPLAAAGPQRTAWPPAPASWVSFAAALRVSDRSVVSQNSLVSAVSLSPR
ncbi:uncharacterized protein [Miscanthus floridulus]|uniref:uncharacterized protein n=1 Tax=Miscanthus floridulus TaxID=154761 RepID=UPI003457B0FA